MKEHTNFICKTAFLEIQHIGTVRHFLTDEATKTLVVSLVLSRIDYCNPWLVSLSSGGKLQSRKQCSPSCSPCTSTCSHHSNTRTCSLVACKNPISYKTACLSFNAITSSTPARLSDLLHLYSSSRSLRSSADTASSNSIL